MFDMMKMLGQVKEIQARVKEAQEKLHLLKVEGESGGGLVKAEVNGKHQLISIKVDPSLIQATDHLVMVDLIVAAVNKALQEADVLAKEEIKKSTEGMLPNIPGLDLTGMMG